jgi:hypothetical protein
MVFIILGLCRKRRIFLVSTLIMKILINTMSMEKKVRKKRRTSMLMRRVVEKSGGARRKRVNAKSLLESQSLRSTNLMSSSEATLLTWTTR